MPTDECAPEEPASDGTAAAPIAAAVVLCGGTSRRFGGGDKTRARLYSSPGTTSPTGDTVLADTVLDVLLVRLPAAWPVWCVGQRRPTVRAVGWTREEPPGGGPIAGVAAGLEALMTSGAGSGPRVPVPPITVVLAGDQPFAGPFAQRLVTDLGRQPQDIDAVAAAGPATTGNGEGRAQPLLAAYRTAPLLRLLSRRQVADAGVYATLRGLRFATVPADAMVLLDVDTPEALQRARALAAATPGAHGRVPSHVKDVLLDDCKEHEFDRSARLPGSADRVSPVRRSPGDAAAPEV